MFVNIGLEVKKSSSSKSAVAGNFTPQPNNHKLLNSMSRNPKMMCGVPCRFWQGTPEVFSKRWKPWSAHSRHCCRFASDRRESFGWPKAKTEETLPRLLVIRRRLRLHGQSHLARRLVSHCWVYKPFYHCLNIIWSGATKFSFWLEFA